MRNSINLWRVVVWCVLVSCFCCITVVDAMPHHEPGHQDDNYQVEEYTSGRQQQNEHIVNQFEPKIMEPEENPVLSPIVMNNNNGSSMDSEVTDFTSVSTETTAETASKSEPTSIITTDEGEVANTTKTSTTTIEFVPNEESRPSSSEEEEVEEPKQQQEVENVVEDAVDNVDPPEPSLNSITPTIPTVLSTPPSLPLLPPPPEPPVIDPISFRPTNDNGADGDNRLVSTAASFFPHSLPIIVPGASSPSIQLIPPPPTNPSLSSSPLSDIPREPDQGEIPESPEPYSPHPFNLQDIPVSLVSLSGNSGGSTSDMATFSSLVSPTDNVPLDFTKFRYHVVTGQLFKIGSTGAGICPENMRFFAVPGHPKNGACDCDYYQCSRPLIYSPEKHQCYWAWSQGPCENGEWFVFDRDLTRRGRCEKNPCPSSFSPNFNDTNVSNLSEYYFQNPEDETCYQAGTKGYCQDADERLLIYPGEPIPKCRKFTSCYPLTVPQELQCVYGNKYFVESGHCQ